MKVKAFAPIALVLALGAATTASAGAAKDQIAAQLGVDGSQYTLAQLVQLQSDRTEDGYGIVDKVGSAPLLGSSGTDTLSANAGKAQIAAQLGLNPADYSLAELSLISDAKSAGHTDTVAYYVSHANRATNDAGFGAKAQLAASLGVNPADYTFAQLAALHTEATVD